MNALIEEPTTGAPPAMEQQVLDEPVTGGPLDDDEDDDEEDDDSEVEAAVPGAPPAPPKRKGGRPKGTTKAAIAAKAAQNANDEPVPKKPVGRPPGAKVNPTKRFWNLLGIGDPVIWFRDGTRNAMPYPAFVSGKHLEGLSLDITIFAPGQTRVDRTENGVRHIDNPDNNIHQMREIGAFDLTEATKALLALVDDDE